MPSPRQEATIAWVKHLKSCPMCRQFHRTFGQIGARCMVGDDLKAAQMIAIAGSQEGTGKAGE